VAKYLIDRYALPYGDADEYAKTAVDLGSTSLAAIVDRYGEQILTDGLLDRRRLGNLVFAQPAERHWLEQLIHPYVRQCFDRDLGNVTGTALAVIPLLFEANLQAIVDEVWVVTCTTDQQLRRLQKRNKLSYEEAIARINSQMPLAEKAKLADLILDNSGSREKLIRQIGQGLGFD
jgi:dephospho-CoA kinase